MKDEEILRKAIEKVVKNGYPNRFIKGGAYLTSNSIKRTLYFNLIFSHSFAKAFWGASKPNVCHNCGKEGVVSGKGMYCPKCRVVHKHESITHWQYHLQQMVVEEQPLKYLEKFL